MPGEAATLVEALDRAANHPAAGLRLLDRRERPTWLPWPEVRERALAVAGRLAARGLFPGERVALVYPTGAAFFEAFFGVLLAGGVPAPLYPPVRLGRLEEYHRRTAAMVAAAGARLVLAAPRVRRVLGQLLDHLPRGSALRLLDELPVAGPLDRPARVAPGDLGLVQFSSGTTGAPRPVALSHRALLAQSRALESYFPDGDGVVHAGVSWLPLYHDMGLVGCVFPALDRPGVLTLLAPEHFVARPAAWLRALSRWGGTVSPAPDFAYALCTERIRDHELDGVDLSRWRLALDGAEPVSPRVLRAFAERFARWGLRAEALTPVYGLSEAALAVTFSPVDRSFGTLRVDRDALAAGRALPDPSGQELVSVGEPVPGFRVEVRDDEGAPLDEGRVGRVWARGPSLMEGYLGLPRDTARVLVDGWLDTGDLGLVHGGELYLVGRARDLVILRGRNHAPQEIERAVEGVPGLRAGCVVAVGHLPDHADREHLLLFVEHRREAEAGDLDALAERCAEAVLSSIGLACDRVEVLAPGTLPRTSSGKLRRSETLRRHLDGSLRPPDPVTPLRVARWVAGSALSRGRARLRE